MNQKTTGRLFLIRRVLPLLFFVLLLAACGSEPVQTEPTAEPIAVSVATETPAPLATAATEGSSTTPITESVSSVVAANLIDGVEVFTDLTKQHLPNQITYSVNPPPGGDHNPAWMNCGVYTQTIPVELAVHSLEHGAVWITYLPDFATDQLELLKTLTKAADYRLLSPNPGQSSPLIATAWGFQLKLEGADDPRLEQFVLKYANRQDGPEYGAPCSGAYGEPEK